MKRDELHSLAVVLRKAFTPPEAPRLINTLAEALFAAELIITQLYGAVMYLPGRAVLMFTPPPRRDRRLILQTLVFLAASKGSRSRRATAALGLGYIAVSLIPPLLRPDGRFWYVKNCAAWPTGTGAGSDLLSNLCMLADRKNISLCLIASNSDNQRLYTRAGFTAVRANPWRGGTLMIRCPPAPMALPPVTHRPVLVAGLGMPK